MLLPKIDLHPNAVIARFPHYGGLVAGFVFWFETTTEGDPGPANRANTNRGRPLHITELDLQGNKALLPDGHRLHYPGTKSNALYGWSVTDRAHQLGSG